MNESYLVCVAKNTIKIWDTLNWNLITQARAFGTLFFDKGYIYLADRNEPRVAIASVDDIIRDNRAILDKA